MSGLWVTAGVGLGLLVSRISSAEPVWAALLVPIAICLVVAAVLEK